MEAVRWLRHWLHAPASRAFPPEAMQEIQDAITRGEAKHDAELCFVVEARLPARYLIGGRRVHARAESLFGDLKVWDTDRRTGVLLYVLLGDYVVEVIPDRGVVARVPEGSWEKIAARMAEYFREDRWKEGALAGIEAAHDLLELYLPPGPGRQHALTQNSVVL
ncbi:MAG TPA: TPM domain-containing protein [Rhodanobacteraceae bacterium]